MPSSLLRIFTDRICPICSKAVHRSKLAAHQRRHEAGRKGYETRTAPAPTFTKRDVPDADCGCGHEIAVHTQYGCSGWEGPSLYALCTCKKTRPAPTATPSA